MLAILIILISLYCFHIGFIAPGLCLLIIGVGLRFYGHRRDESQISPSFRGVHYTTCRSRDEFHELLHGAAKHRPPRRVYMTGLDSLGRVIGACVTYNGESLTANKRAIKNGRVVRDDEARKKAHVPGYNSVKRKWVTINGQDFPLYHRTHLMPYRFCLNDGEYGTVMFTGSARLNSGVRPESNYIPTSLDHNANVSTIRNMISRDPFYYMDPSHSSPFSLDDFERAADALVFASRDSYQHTYQYGTECFYNDNGLIPYAVQMVCLDLTSRRTLFVATLLNK